MKARLSVCIPTYNGAPFVAEAIGSVLSQSCSDYRLIVVDDCSTDGTLDVVRGFADPRMQLIEGERNLGLIGNWNRALDLADGELVVLLHQDDVLGAGFMAGVVDFFDRHPEVGIVSAGGRPIDREGKVNSVIRLLTSRYRTQSKTRILSPGAESVLHLVAYGATISGIVVRRAIYEELGKFDPAFPYSADEEMWTRIAQRYPLGLLPGTLVYQRNHATQFRAQTWARPDFLEQYLAVQTRRLLYAGAAAIPDPRHLVARTGAAVAFRMIAGGNIRTARSYLDACEAMYPPIIRDPKHAAASLFCRLPQVGRFVCQNVLALN